MKQTATIHKSLLLGITFVLLSSLGVMAQSDDKALLREAHFSAPTQRKSVPYGIEPERKTLSPLYHGASSALWLWENFVAPDICTPGGYTDTNTAYFKALVNEYGALRAIVYGIDRTVRNTKIGRISSPTNPRGLIEDSVERYRQ